MGVTISHLILEIIKSKREKVEFQGKLIQDQERINIERSKMNANWFLSAFPNFPELLNDWIENPEKLQEYYKKLMKFSEGMKKFYTKEQMKRFYPQKDKETTE